MVSEGLIEFVDVGFAYPGAKLPVFSGINACFEAGKFWAVIGPSGSGKSTLLSVAAGFRVPSSGRARLFELDSTLANENDIRRLRARFGGVVFQQTNLLPRLTIRENLRVASLVAGLVAVDAEKRGVELLDSLGITDLADRPVWKLSGGERVRAALSRALVHRPRVVFADEPTGTLDVASKLVVAQLLRQYVDEQNALVIVVSHDEPLWDCADEVIDLGNRARDVAMASGTQSARTEGGGL